MGLRIYLDDNRTTPAGWERAHTAEEVKLHLLHGEVDDLSIDHDLDMPECHKCNFQCGHRGHHHPSGEPQQDCAHNCDCHRQGDETGLDLTQWMVTTGHWPKNRPTIHSHNLHHGMKIAALIGDHFPQK